MAALLVQIIALTITQFTVLVSSQALVEGRCSRVKTLAVKYGKSLDGHLIASYPVEKEDDCQLKCFWHRLCVSYNLGPVVENDVRECEISKSDEFRDPQNMTDRPGYFYRGTENSCSSGPCIRNATCIPNFESDVFQCECPPGFTGNNCATDIDECGRTDNCHSNAHCNNTVGSFECFCKKGFTGNGRICSDVNECNTNQHDCLQHNGECINTAGSFNCSCKPGFHGDGVAHCTDVDECQEQTHTCSENARCNNTEGSFDCVCNEGFFGNGQVCEEQCRAPLGMEDGTIADEQINASSVFHNSPLYAGNRGRLHNDQGASSFVGWISGTRNVDQWLQVDMLTQYTRITGVATQGRTNHSQRVKTYQLQFSNNGMEFQYYKERGQNGSKLFAGNKDKNTVVYHYLNPPIRARYIRFRPQTWNRWIVMRVELYGCQDCHDALGMESGAIPDDRISSSSVYDVNHAAHQGRLNFRANTGSWSARPNDGNQWLQIDLGSKHTVTRVATQGRATFPQWVTKYSLQYHTDQGQNPQNYEEEMGGQQVRKEFTGNTDQNTAVYHYLNPPISARYIRFLPVAWNGHISMRVELYGCPDIDECATGEHRCHLSAMCTNKVDSYTCTCKPPYFGNGFHCQDPVPPTFRSVPKSIAVEEQQNVNFTCLAHGLPTPVITWTKVGGSLPVGWATYSQGSLLLMNVSPKDSGNFTCTAFNVAGNVTSPAAELLVHSLLMFTLLPPLRPIYIFAGDSLTLPCSADSDLKPTLGWRMLNSKGVEIFPNNTLFIATANLSHTGSYNCTANNTFRMLEESIIVYVYALPSCRDIKSRQLNMSGNAKKDTSGYYFIDPDGGGVGESPFAVLCNMTTYDRNSVTVISHDSENRTLVDGYSRVGSYERVVTYIGASLEQIINLINVSVECRQFIKYECFKATLLHKERGWWESRTGKKMDYWGGAIPSSKACACGQNLSCVDPSLRCNCDSNRKELLEDSGFLSDKNTLPVTRLRFGDTGNHSGYGYHTLGKLMCIGEAIAMPSPIAASTTADAMTITPSSEIISKVLNTSASKSTEVIPVSLIASTSTDSIVSATTTAYISSEVTPTVTPSTIVYLEP